MSSKLETLFMDAWREHGYAESDITTEYKMQGYRYDVVFPGAKLAIELQGFGYGHQRIGAMKRDAAKLRAAVLSGWTVLVYTSGCLGSKAAREDAVTEVMRLLEHRMLGTPLVEK